MSASLFGLGQHLDDDAGGVAGGDLLKIGGGVGRFFVSVVAHGADDDEWNLVELIRMGSLCEEAISIAAKALEGNEKVDAGRVFSLENDIDQMEHDIESRCMRMLLQQQPVATDLRVISAALKMISDMERIGDQAADIAEMVDYVKDTVAQGKVHITNMARAAVSMVTESVEAFVQADMKLAQKVVQDDDKVDELFSKVRKELIQSLKDESGNPEAILDLLMIAKYFERIGDHAVNIAEWVEYSITGVHKSSEHHQEV